MEKMLGGKLSQELASKGEKRKHLLHLFLGFKWKENCVTEQELNAKHLRELVFK